MTLRTREMKHGLMKQQGKLDSASPSIQSHTKRIVEERADDRCKPLQVVSIDEQIGHEDAGSIDDIIADEYFDLVTSHVRSMVLSRPKANGKGTLPTRG